MRITKVSVKEKKLANRPNRKYNSILADEYHRPIQSLTHLRDCWCPTMGFFCNGVLIGKGELCHFSPSKTEVHTDATRLFRGFRRKGHGIELYKTLINHAKKLGATRIYSGTSLNKYSHRMWKEKLSSLYEVKEVQKCKCRCKRCRDLDRFYIDLV